MLAGHRRLDDGLLHWTPVVVCWFGSKLVETEPALQLLAGIVPLAAPGAPGIGTCEVPESAHEVPGLRELMAHPGRHDRVAAGHREPRQRIGQRPAALLQLRQYLPAVGRASRALQAPADHCQRLSLRRTGRLSEFPEEFVQSAVRAVGLGRAQPMPGREQIRRSPFQGSPLVTKNLQRESGIQFRIVDASSLEPAVLIVLDEVVIGMAGKGEWAEAQRIHRRQCQQTQFRLRGCQVGQVEADQVVPQNEGRPIGELVELQQRFRQSAAGMHQALAGIRSDRADRVDAAILPANLQVERKAARPKQLIFQRRRCTRIGLYMCGSSG